MSGMAESELAPPLPCPECRESGCGGGARIGNRRRQCGTCNRFIQAVRRETLNRLRDAHKAEHARIRIRVEADLYRQVIANYVEETS